MKNYTVAVVGATGAVGNEMIKILEERQFPVGKLTLLASERSVGKTLAFRGGTLPVEVLDENSFTGVQIGLFSAGGSISEKFAPIAARAGCVVVDNTSAFRMVPEIPLVVPEVNPEAIARYTNRGIIANPNCSTIQMVVALKPIHDAVRIKRIVVSTYQAVSGTGKKAIEELTLQTRALLNVQEAGCQGLSPSDRLQLSAPHRRLSGERLYEGRDEDGQRDQEDHERLPRSPLRRRRCGCPFSTRTPSRSTSKRRRKSPRLRSGSFWRRHRG